MYASAKNTALRMAELDLQNGIDHGEKEQGTKELFERVAAGDENAIRVLDEVSDDAMLRIRADTISPSIYYCRQQNIWQLCASIFAE